MSSDKTIDVVGLSKCYQIYGRPQDRLLQMIYRGRRQYYKEFWALRDISFTIKKGETVGIIGRNGSGKSTLLQLICGTLHPTAGTICTNGRIAALLELGSGFNPEFTGRENIYMNSSILGLKEAEIDERFDAIAAFADIGDFLEQPVKVYSSGMYVRLAFAVNIMSAPEIMIVDEALSVGDMAFQAKCMTALHRIQEQGATILFVSHDIGSVKSLCSRAIYLDHGCLKSVGSAGRVAEEYIQTIREEMNTKVSVEKAPEEKKTVNPISDDSCGSHATGLFKQSKEFDHRVAQFRYGTGGARIRFAELVDMHDQPVVSAEFNQEVTVKIYFEVEKEIPELSVNYYIQDDKKNVILGADSLLAGGNFLHCLSGRRYIVSYTALLPLCEGRYSVQLELTKPLVIDQSVEFLDVVDDAIVFEIQRRQGTRIWARVYLPNFREVEEL